MIQVDVSHPAVRRALIQLLTPLGPVAAPSAAASGNPALIVSDRPLPETGAPVLLLGGEGLALPVRAADLLARVQQTLERHTAPSDTLTAREQDLLAALASAAPAAISRDTLLQQVWRYDPQAETHTIETHIYRLRQKLEALGDPRQIVTVPGGYRLEGLPSVTGSDKFSI